MFSRIFSTHATQCSSSFNSLSGPSTLLLETNTYVMKKRIFLVNTDHISYFAQCTSYKVKRHWNCLNSRTERNYLFFSVKKSRYWLSRRVSDKSHNVSRQMWPWPGRIGTIPRPTGLSGGGQVVWSCWGGIQRTHPTASERDWGSEWPWSRGDQGLGKWLSRKSFRYSHNILIKFTQDTYLL